MKWNYDMTPHDWLYTQFCEFNSTSSALLVSGVMTGRNLFFTNADVCPASLIAIQRKMHTLFGFDPMPHLTENRSSSSGEVAIFHLTREDFRPLMRLKNKPYDIFSAWFDERQFLTGKSRERRKNI